MNAASIARRMAAKHGHDVARSYAEGRHHYWSFILNYCTAPKFTYTATRVILWRAVSTALGRMEASV